jgi:tRNA uridine 5-carbamoylmethylation protein Kti12
MTPTITIIRGLPGSGKTRLARRLAKKHGTLLIEPDMFLIRNGAYHYDPIKYQFATAAAIQCIQTAAKLRADIIYADVLPRIVQAMSLIELYQAACPAKTSYQIIDCKHLTTQQSIRRNTHNVRPEDIHKMAADWQPYTPAKSCNAMQCQN